MHPFRFCGLYLKGKQKIYYKHITKGNTVEKNIGGIEKTVRIIAGIVIIAAGVYFKSWFGAIGIVPLATGLMSFCPIWTAIGFSTADKKLPQ